LLIRHSKYNAILSKIHFYGLLNRRFCSLGIGYWNRIITQFITQEWQTAFISKSFKFTQPMGVGALSVFIRQSRTFLTGIKMS